MEIPKGITINVEDSLVRVKGPKGEIEKNFAKNSVSTATIKLNGNNIEVSCENLAIKTTFETHIKNMIYGVQNEYSKTLKMVYAHFPFTVEIKGDMLYIKNFLGEKQARMAKIIGKTKVETKTPHVVVSGVDKDAVGQTVANIKQALRIRNKDSRIFQDGLYEVA